MTVGAAETHRTAVLLNCVPQTLCTLDTVRGRVKSACQNEGE